MKKYKLAIIGGGPAGIISAISCGKHLNPHDIIIIEKNDSLGKKLLLTGGGRCNIANSISITEQLKKVSDETFLKHSFHTLTPKNLLKIFEDKGINFKIDENNKIFPITNNALSILKILKMYLDDLKIDILLNNPVKYITKSNHTNFNDKEYKNQSEDKEIFKIRTNKLNIFAEKVIVATGGFSYPQTGSTGDGHKIAIDFTHKLSKIHPGLVPLKVNVSWLKELSGITFKNVKISFKDPYLSKNSKSKKITVYGNILLTHFGLSGPGILDISNDILKTIYKYENTFKNSKEYDNLKDNKHDNLNHEYNELKDKEYDKLSDKRHVDLKDNEYNESMDKEYNKLKDSMYNSTYINRFIKNTFISIDFIPKLSEDDLKMKITEDSQNMGKVKIKNYMKFYLKNRFIDRFLKIAKVDKDNRLSNLNKKKRNSIITNLKDFKLEINGFMENTSMITCGGVKTSEINPKTMESKIVKGLYFVGEILETYGPTGGYNLQIAFSTGYLGGESVSKSFDSYSII
jgi:predicted Rossmann fold flavoprotein